MRIIPFNYNNVVHCKICAFHSFQLQQQGLCVSFLSTATTWYTSRFVRIIPFNCNNMVHFKICEYHPANFKRSPMTPRVTHTHTQNTPPRTGRPCRGQLHRGLEALVVPHLRDSSTPEDLGREVGEIAFLKTNWMTWGTFLSSQWTSCFLQG